MGGAEGLLNVQGVDKLVDWSVAVAVGDDPGTEILLRETPQETSDTDEFLSYCFEIAHVKYASLQALILHVLLD